MTDTPTFLSLQQIPGVALATSRAGRKAFADGKASLLVVPLTLPEGASAAFRELTGRQMGDNGQAFLNRSHRADAYSLFDTGGDWGFGGDMYETHINPGATPIRQIAALARQMGKKLYAGHPGAADVGAVFGELARTFARLATPQDTVALGLTYGFDHAPGPRLLPEDARPRPALEKMMMHRSPIRYRMEAVLHGPGMIILADDPARHGWLAPNSSYHRDRDGDQQTWWTRQKQLEEQAQNELIARFGAAQVPAGCLVITRTDIKPDTRPVVLSQPRWNESRGVSATGWIHTLRNN